MSNFKAKFDVITKKTEEFFDCNNYTIKYMYRWVAIVAIGTQVCMAVYINNDPNRCDILQTVDRDGEIISNVKLCGKDLMKAIRKQQSK